MDDMRDDGAMTDGDVASFARSEATRQARVMTGGAIVLALIGVALVIAWVVAIRAPMQDTFGAPGHLLGSAIGLLLGAALLVMRARKARRAVTR